MSIAKATEYGFSEYNAVVGSNDSGGISLKKGWSQADVKRLLGVQP